MVFVWLREGHKFPLVDNVENEVEYGGEASEVVLTAGGDSNRVVVVGRNNEVGIGRNGELVGEEFLLEHVLELESLSIPDLHRIVEITGTHKNTPVGGVRDAIDGRGVSLVDALHQASIGRVPKFDGSIVTSRAKGFAVGREREGPDDVGVALQRVR